MSFVIESNSTNSIQVFGKTESTFQGGRPLFTPEAIAVSDKNRPRQISILDRYIKQGIYTTQSRQNSNPSVGQQSATIAGKQKMIDRG